MSDAPCLTADEKASSTNRIHEKTPVSVFPVAAFSEEAIRESESVSCFGRLNVSAKPIFCVGSVTLPSYDIFFRRAKISICFSPTGFYNPSELFTKFYFLYPSYGPLRKMFIHRLCGNMNS